MDRREERPVVLARIPNLNSSRANETIEGPPASSGRILGQAFSFRILAGVTVLLVAVAIVPLTFKRDAPTTEAAPAWNPGALADTGAAWPAPVAETGSAWPASVAETSASPSPTERVSSERSVAGVISASATIDEPLMSTWPNPSQPTSPQAEAGAEESRADVNQSMALRPSEHIRNSYDRTRPSVR